MNNSITLPGLLNSFLVLKCYYYNTITGKSIFHLICCLPLFPKYQLYFFEWVRQREEKQSAIIIRDGQSRDKKSISFSLIASFIFGVGGVVTKFFLALFISCFYPWEIMAVCILLLALFLGLNNTFVG